MPACGSHSEYVFEPSGKVSSVISWLAACFRLWKNALTLRNGTLYVVCSRSNFGFLRDLPALILANFNFRVVVHSHGSDILDLLTKRRISPLARAVYQGCELVVPSDHLRSPLEDHTKHVEVCENFFQVTGLSQEWPQSQRFRVLWNSNIMSSKGFFDVAEAIARLVDKNCEIVLTVLGAAKGDLEMSLKDVLKKLSTYQRFEWVDFVGRVEHHTLSEYISQSDLIALPSRYPIESQGIAVIEGMCSGRALIVSDIPALQTTIRGYPSETVPTNDIDALEAAISRLVEEKRNDPKGFFERRQEPAQFARERFSIERFDSKMIEILRAKDSQ
ncbi:MAG: glycosyltransferase family 4 protein [Pseudomonadota bacterium]